MVGAILSGTLFVAAGATQPALGHGLRPVEAIDGPDQTNSDPMAFWFDPYDAPGTSWDAYWGKHPIVVTMQTATITATAPNTYFELKGANSGDAYPSFYGGVQELTDGRHVGLFSAWDVGKVDCSYFLCKPGDAPISQQVTALDAATDVQPRRGGGEGTFMQSLFDLDWKVGQPISWMVALGQHSSKKSVLAVAVKLGDADWRFVSAYLVPAQYSLGLSGGYAFIENYGAQNPYALRQMKLTSTVALTGDDKVMELGRVFVNSAADVYRHGALVQDSWVVGSVGTSYSTSAQATYQLAVPPTGLPPQFAAGYNLLVDRLAKNDAWITVAGVPAATWAFNPAAVGVRWVGANAVVSAGAGFAGHVQLHLSDGTIDGYDGYDAELTGLAPTATLEDFVPNTKIEWQANGVAQKPILVAYKFTTCAGLWATFDGGLAKSAKAKNKGKKAVRRATVSSSFYASNKALDKDHDGLVCER